MYSGEGHTPVEWSHLFTAQSDTYTQTTRDVKVERLISKQLLREECLRVSVGICTGTRMYVPVCHIRQRPSTRTIFPGNNSPL